MNTNMNANVWTDTHCHLAENELSNFSSWIEQTQSPIRLIVPATNPNDWQTVLDLRECAGVRAIALGLHPYFVSENHSENLDSLDCLARLLAVKSDCWVGEIGLDFYRGHSKPLANRNEQIECFKIQLDLAKQLNCPIIIHNLRASQEIVACLKSVRAQRGIIHGFSGSLEEANQFIKLGFKLGMGALLLNPNAKKTRQCAGVLPLENLLLETDSPFSAGGKRENSPILITQIAQELANLRKISLSELSEQMELNLKSFGL